MPNLLNHVCEKELKTRIHRTDDVAESMSKARLYGSYELGFNILTKLNWQHFWA